MWAINGHRNCVRVHAVCTEPLGLVLELCNAGRLDQWLWTTACSTINGERARRLLSNHLLQNSAASQKSPPVSISNGEDVDSSEEEEDDTFESLLADGVVRGCFTPVQRILACTDVINAVDYLHGRHVSHGDIKADNVLVQRLSDSVLSCKLGDFGSAKVARSWTGEGSTMQAKNATGGTERWQSKEALVAAQRQRAGSSVSSPADHLTVDDRCSDVYSLILLIASILTSLPPYADLSDWPLVDAIRAGTLPYDEQQLHAVSPQLLKLVRLWMAVDTRPSMLELKYEHWPAIMEDLIAAPNSSSSSAMKPDETSSKAAALLLAKDTAVSEATPSSSSSIATTRPLSASSSSPAERSFSSSSSSSTQPATAVSGSLVDKWLYADGSGSEYGPVDFDDMKAAWSSGRLTAASLVCRSGVDVWHPMTTMAELKSLLLLPTPQPAAGAVLPAVAASTSTWPAQRLLSSTGVECDMERSAGSSRFSKQSGRVTLRCTLTKLSWRLVEKRLWGTKEDTYRLADCEVRVDSSKRHGLVVGVTTAVRLELVHFTFSNTSSTIMNPNPQYTEPVPLVDVVAVVMKLAHDAASRRSERRDADGSGLEMDVTGVGSDDEIEKVGVERFHISRLRRTGQ